MNAMLTLAAFTQHTFHGTFDGGSKREEWEETWFSFSLSLNSIEELHHREEEQGRKRDIERTKKSSLVGHNVLYMKRWWRFVWEEEGNDEEKVTHSKDWTKRQLSVGGISQCSSSSYDVLCLLCSLEGVHLVQDKEWLGGKHTGKKMATTKIRGLWRLFLRLLLSVKDLSASAQKQMTTKKMRRDEGRGS